MLGQFHNQRKIAQQISLVLIDTLPTTPLSFYFQGQQAIFFLRIFYLLPSEHLFSAANPSTDYQE